MPSPTGVRQTMIHYIEGGPPGSAYWRIQVTNVPQFYLFAGVDETAQFLNVSNLAMLMQNYSDNPQSFIAQLGSVIDIPQGQTAATATEILFDESNQLFFVDSVITETIGDTTLIDVMWEAGDDLAEAVAVFLP